MALTSFAVNDQKALRYAACDEVPPVMVIAGPNGVGKSTLLDALRQKQGVTLDPPETVVMYQPPHRAMRRQTVRRRFLSELTFRFQEVLAENQVQRFEGLDVPTPERSATGVDEAGSMIKWRLSRIENRQSDVLAKVVLEAKPEPLQTANLPDVYGPLKTLVTRLLPHLEFVGVDTSNANDVKCLFRRRDGVSTVQLDLDDLSSGEKSILLLFLPFIEDQMDRLLSELDPEDAQQQAADESHRVLIIDEPEQHLHPHLQERILGYLRELTTEQNVQFIIATHSPTLVDQAFDDELYVLRFPPVEGENQLRRVASSGDRLEAIRELTGNTYIVTTGRTIVCIEGEEESRSSPTDAELIEVLSPGATKYVFVPTGGKGHVINTVQRLRDVLAKEQFNIDVLGIVDSDRSNGAPSGVVTWPVSSVENLLLAPDVIADTARALGSGEVTAARVDAILTEAANAVRDEEIKLRVMDALKPRTIRIKGSSVAEIEQALKAERESLQLERDQIEQVLADAERVVDDALKDRSFLQRFRGKSVLRNTYRELGLPAGVSYARFVTELANRCTKRKEVMEILTDVFAQLDSERVQASPEDRAE